MYCPYCGWHNTKVTNSRLTRGNTQIWRRRRCLKCKEAFTSHELIDLSHLIVTKKSGKAQRFNRLKVYSGIYNATIGFDMTHRVELVQRVSNKVERVILGLRRKAITSDEIADIVLHELRRENAQTFLRFLAYTKDVSTETEMIREFNRYTK